MLVDSHCHLDHLDLSGRAGGLAVVLEDARARNISKFLSVAVDLEKSGRLLQLAKQHQGVYISVGVHPLQHTDIPVPAIEELVTLAAESCVVAIGETGLDYHYSQDNADWQMQSFENQLQAATLADKPVIVHSRAAQQDTIDALRRITPARAGVMHCYTESWEMAKQALDLGFYISFSGILTFRNADALRDVARKIPLERLLVETDSPWLAPVPHRGKQNEPQYVLEVAKKLAELRDLRLEQIAEITTQNFNRLFQLAH